MRKKILSLLLALSMVFVLAACDPEFNVKIIFDGNGGFANVGGGSIAIAEVPANTKANLANVASREGIAFSRVGYIFAGWTTVQGNKNTLVTSVDVRTTTVTVYAYWEEIKVNTVYLIFDLRGMTPINNYTVEVPVNSTQVLMDVMHRENININRDGYNLVGWTTSPGDRNTLIAFINIGTTSVTVYAYWEPKVTSVNVIFHGNGAVNRNGQTTFSVSVPANSTHKLSEIEPQGTDMFYIDDDIRFIGWTAVPNVDTTWIFLTDVKESDITVYAYWYNSN